MARGAKAGNAALELACRGVTAARGLAGARTLYSDGSSSTAFVQSRMHSSNACAHPLAAHPQLQ